MRIVFVSLVLSAVPAFAAEPQPVATPVPPPAAGALLPGTRPEPRSEVFPPAWNVGAQAEFVGPISGVSGAVLGYDGGAFQAELSVGLGLGPVPTEATPRDRTDVYTASLRVAVPVHRGVRADFSLLFAAGAIVIERSGAASDANGTAGVGGRIRSFFTPNVALMGTLGFVTVFDGDDAAYFIGARPLGSAAVVYFFR